MLMDIQIIRNKEHPELKGYCYGCYNNPVDKIILIAGNEKDKTEIDLCYDCQEKLMLALLENLQRGR